jgi:hypothetical protein
MNAPQQAATCPTCKGSGVRTKTWVKWGSDREREKPQRCLACRGSGQVDPLRVCQTCGQWADQCTCPKSKIIKLWKVDEMNGVIWIEKARRYRVEFSRNGTHYYLGQYADKALAVRCRMEADHTPDDQLPALRQKYAALKKNGNGHAAPEPAETQAIGLSHEAFAATIAPLDQPVPAPSADELSAKLADALAKDQRFREIRERYCAAERDAVEAWNEYARELATSGQSDAFARSYLGFLREEITRS